MPSGVIWEYDERIQAGASYADLERARAWDRQIGKIRNPVVKAQQIIQQEYVAEINTFLNDIKVNTGEEFYHDSLLHVKEEFSTFDWLMDEMLEHTGFEILEKIKNSKINLDYVCRKK